MKLKYVLYNSGANPPAQLGTTAVPLRETILPQRSTTLSQGTTMMSQGNTPAGGGTEGERPLCQSSLNVCINLDVLS